MRRSGEPVERLAVDARPRADVGDPRHRRRDGVLHGDAERTAEQRGRGEHRDEGCRARRGQGRDGEGDDAGERGECRLGARGTGHAATIRPRAARDRHPAGVFAGRAALHDGMTTFGILGAGNIGSNVAKALLAHGHEVVIANSRGPETLAGLVAELGPRARAATVEEAAEAGEVVLVAVPLRAYREVPVAPLAGKIVLDANNYYFERDGHVDALDRGEATTSGLLQAHLPESKVAKAFNHLGAASIPTDGTPAGTPNRRAIATASDVPEASEFVTRLYDELGFDTVDIGPLAESWRVERDRPAYGIRQNRDELVANLAKAPRTI